MPEPFKTEEITEKLILVGVSRQDDEDTEDSLTELAELVETAGGLVVGTAIQNRESVHPGTYVGKGKLEELQQMISELEADGIVCDDELSPAQLRNMEDVLECRVMDRTLVILDIFAARASTSEGKIQVELAQLKYRMSRLTGLGISLSRLGGGIGTRGPGEKKLEMDRRLIKNRIAQLNRELVQVQKHREITRGQREHNQTRVAAIVGYTNAGKSTLLNRLTHASVLEEDMLFATLDPTTRNLKLDSGQEILLTDTVGFIRKLPHHLIEAFRSTLEEARYADIILHVVDASSPQREKQMEIVYETLQNLGVSGKKTITLFNKQDKVEEQEGQKDFQADKSLKISARSGQGLEELKEALEEILREDKQLLEGIFPYDQGGQLTVIRKYGELLEEEYGEQGIYVKAFVPAELYRNLEKNMKTQEAEIQAGEQP
ncbi:GTP-binding protein HflX [Eubacterium sp. 14-2]|uniref:GTPase HflX n=1 Tax=Eubacterium sp. 14-2 TaxID=1235790 RepID=UPI0003406916|nr:GTPase HflX [Eubacterium sp. 14-2]EOT21735.1 GTP-binding protein HflX [Eubacterium sp. 14-2]